VLLPNSDQPLKNLKRQHFIRFGFSLQLNELDKKTRPARNKILSHNDLESILNGGIVGDFPDGMDDKYFKTLQEFVDVLEFEVIREIRVKPLWCLGGHVGRLQRPYKDIRLVGSLQSLAPVLPPKARIRTL
jgi:hypothetical protein